MKICMSICPLPGTHSGRLIESGYDYTVIGGFLSSPLGPGKLVRKMEWGREDVTSRKPNPLWII